MIVLKNILSRGLKKDSQLYEIKTVHLTNFYCIFIFIYAFIFGIVNVFESQYLIGVVNLLLALLLAVNYAVFGKIKNIRIASNITFVLFSIVLFCSFISGGNNGTGILWLIVFPLSALQLCGIKKGTIYFILSIIIQIIFSYIKIHKLVFDYTLMYANYTDFLSRLIFIQIFVYFTALYFYKNREDLLRKIDEANRQKTNFFINIAHETKTPLTLVSNYLDKYTRTKNTDDLEIIKNNINKMRRDIVNYFDLEKLVACKNYYDNNQIINMTLCILEKIKLFKEFADKKSIKIKHKIENNLFTKIDPCAIDRVVNNLLENAIKYTPPQKHIIVELSGQGNKVILKVVDSGLGIEAGKLPHIFEPYYQIQNEKRNIHGMGLGLSIVKKIIDLVNGEIFVQSRVHEGSSFTVVLDAYLPGNNDMINTIIYSKPFVMSEVRLDEDRYSKGRYNILIVDDNIELLNYLQENISVKYNTFLAINGRHALDKLKNIPKPNLVIADIMMDEMDGNTFYSELNNEAKYNDVPFIFLTAKTAREDRLHGLAQGAIDYITKPFMIDELIIKIDSIIKSQVRQIEFMVDAVKNRLSQFYNNIDEKDGKYLDNFNSVCGKYLINEKGRDVIRLLLDGCEYKEISSELKMPIGTVKKYIQNIYRKCQVQNKVELSNKFNK